MPSPAVSFAPHPETTPQTELSVLADVYRFVLDCHAKKGDRLPDKSGLEDARKDQDARTYPHCT